MAGLWGIIVPEAGTNLIVNPSAGLAGNFSAYNSATVTRDTAVARFGDYSYKIVPGGTNRGVTLTASGINATYSGYLSVYVYGTISGSIQVSGDASSTWTTMAIVGGSVGGWVRYGAALPADNVHIDGSDPIFRDTAADTFYLNGAQYEQNNTTNASYITTYIDGDQPGLYRWTGLRHGSTSTRNAQERLGGREQDLQTAYGIRVRQYPGAGMPPIANNQQALALQPGSLFQSSRFLPRTLTLISDIHNSTVPSFHSRRKALIGVINPQGKRGAQPFVLSYSGALSTKKVYGQFRYESGLEFGQYTGGANVIEASGLVNIKLLAVDPFWYEDNRETATLGFTAGAATTAYGLRRTNGAWSKFGSGFNGVVRCFIYHPNTGRLYVGGDFTTANGVTVSRICYWNGTTFVAMDAGVGNGGVYALALAPNGDLWVGGTFTATGTGAATSVGLAKWSLSGSSWSVPASAATGFTGIYALAVDTSSNLYGGGLFATIGGIANTVNIFKYDGSNITALGAGITSGGAQVNALVWNAITSLLYVGGVFTTANSVTVQDFMYWNASTFVAATATGTPVYSLVVDTSGNVYGSSGSSTGIFKWNGTSNTALGSGLAGLGAVYSLAISPSNILFVGGNFSSAGGYTVPGLALWNGTTWVVPDLYAAADRINVVGFMGEDLLIGFNATAVTWNYSAQTTFTPSSTAITFPTITLIGPSSVSCTLVWIENQSTTERQYYSLPVYSGETVTIDGRPDQTPVQSTWRGPIQNQPFMSSDDLRLLPDSNTIAAYIYGTVTAAALLMHWVPTHLSIDGAAA